MKVIIIDNYDSFVYNICDYIGRLDRARIEVYRNDAVSVDEIVSMEPDGIIISPGPGNPDEAGISVDLIKKTAGSIPLLGVCLGHQCLGAAFGGRIIRAQRILHGKTSMIYHEDSRLFKNIKSPFSATRYHSLIIDKSAIPDILKITAHTDKDEVMGIEHRQLPLYGVQFHPESILTDEGLKLIENFIDIVGDV